MQKPQIKGFNKVSLRGEIPNFRAGDTVKARVEVIEGSHSRIQIFQDIVVVRRGVGVEEAFAVCKLSFNTRVGRTFPLHVPTVDKIEIVSRGDVYRAKFYYLRNRYGKATKVTGKRDNETTA